METKGFRYEFTGKELSSLLFKKKKCPKCNGKLVKKKCSEVVNGSVYNTISVPLYIKGRRVKHYFYIYSCKSCNLDFTLNDLSK